MANMGSGLEEDPCGADGDAAEAAHAPPPCGAHAAPRSQRAVGMSVACMSRAGCEPAYKKTNQDSCFAFEKFVSEEESLFGTMDGHGPQGAPRMCHMAIG
jgi:hypothetical protein